MPLWAESRIHGDVYVRFGGRLSITLDAKLGDWRGVTPKRCYLRRYLARGCRPEPNAAEAARRGTP